VLLYRPTGTLPRALSVQSASERRRDASGARLPPGKCIRKCSACKASKTILQRGSRWDFSVLSSRGERHGISERECLMVHTSSFD
jgi:hypothetical protein